ncbi:hypothetical protein D3C86_1445810 [compost metagenome]
MGAGGSKAQRATRAQVDQVGKLPVQRHILGDDDHLALRIIRADSHLGDDVAALLAALVLVFQLHQGLGAFIGVDLADHDLAGGGNLMHRQRCAQRVIGAWEGPVVQGAVGIGFAQFGAWVDGVFGLGAGHRCPEEQGAVLGIEVLALVTLDQPGGFDGSGWAADRHAQVPGSEVNHV